MTCSLTLARKSYHTKNTAWFSTAVLKLIYNDTNFLSKHYFPFTALFLVYGLLFAAFMRAHFQQLQRYSLQTVDSEQELRMRYGPSRASFIPPTVIEL